MLREVQNEEKDSRQGSKNASQAIRSLEKSKKEKDQDIIRGQYKFFKEHSATSQ